jgi:dihydroflavonol-4-reductase
MSMLDTAKVLKARLADAASKVPTRELSYWRVRLAARFDPSRQQLLPLPGRLRNVTSAKAERVLGWKSRSSEDAVAATAESLLKLGLTGPAAG